MTAEKPKVRGDVPRRLVHRLREALVSVLAEGSWSQIEDDHRRVGLGWREDLKPGWGKPKYVEHVLEDLPDEEVIAVGRRTAERFPERSAFAVEDALLWIDARGIARVTELTRLSLAALLEGRRLHPREAPSDVLGRFARCGGNRRFKYAADGSLVAVDSNPFSFLDEESERKVDQLALLDAYGFRGWPDARLFRLLEFLVDPRTRQHDEQSVLVEAINGVLSADRFELAASEQVSGHAVFKVRPLATGVAGRPKNLIFASTGPKPELGFADAVNNDIAILANGEHCLIYEDPIGDSGLSWFTLVAWWAARNGLDPSESSTRKGLADRLLKSLGSPPERRLFAAYFQTLRPRFPPETLPALVPQVYLHYDPMTLRELRARGDGRRFDVQRMDFLLLLPHNVRVVIEVDGQQHYSTGSGTNARPSPEEYARTVRGDRHLRLTGYEVYRFGGYELHDDITCRDVVDDFFTRLFRRHQLVSSSATPA